MSSAPPVSTADPHSDWRQRLLAVSLPAVSDEASWQTLVKGSEDAELIHEQIALDLPLALSLLVEANRSPRIAAGLSGLQHALRMYGNTQVLARLRAWKGGQLDPAQPAHRLALQAMATSRLAWRFLSRWMRHALVPDAEFRLWVTALLGVVRWKLPLVDPRLALEVERRVAAGERRQHVERRLLGCRVDELNTLHLLDLGFADAPALLGRLRLAPGLLGRAARLARDDGPAEALSPALARRLREPLATCGLAYALALETQADWNTPRCTRLLRAVATCLNRAPSLVLQDMHRAAIEASGETLYTRGLLAPAARLIRIPRPRRADAAAPANAGTTPRGIADRASATPLRPDPPPPVAEASARPAPAPASTPAGARADSGAHYLARCRSQAFTSLPQFLHASAGMLADAGLPRCALFLRMKQPERIANYYSSGLGDPAALRRLSFPASAGPLLDRLLADPHGAFWIQPKQLMGVRGKLPPALANWPPPGGFILATVQVNEAPMGFWWTDAGDTSDLVDARRFAIARQMAGVFGVEFTRLIKAQRAGSR